MPYPLFVGVIAYHHFRLGRTLHYPACNLSYRPICQSTKPSFTRFGLDGLSGDISRPIADSIVLLLID